MDRIVVNLETGETSVIPFTAEEAAAIIALAAQQHEVPHSITPLQARKALRAAGLKSAVDAYVASLGEEAQEEWQYASEVRRDNPTLIAAASALGLGEEALDQLFISASTFV